jgi:hypothetical protein
LRRVRALAGPPPAQDVRRQAPRHVLPADRRAPARLPRLRAGRAPGSRRGGRLRGPAPTWRACASSTPLSSSARAARMLGAPPGNFIWGGASATRRHLEHLPEEYHVLARRERAGERRYHIKLQPLGCGFGGWETLQEGRLRNPLHSTKLLAYLGKQWWPNLGLFVHAHALRRHPQTSGRPAAARGAERAASSVTRSRAPTQAATSAGRASRRSCRRRAPRCASPRRAAPRREVERRHRELERRHWELERR